MRRLLHRNTKSRKSKARHCGGNWPCHAELGLILALILSKDGEIRAQGGQFWWNDMNRRTVLLLGATASILAACSVGASQSGLGPDGRPLPKAYRISKSTAEKIPFRLLDSVNALRAAKGAPVLNFSAELNAASLTHSRDMSVQNRPWHFGSDGSSPLLRAQRVGYPGKFLGELISETYENELETLAAWMAQPDTRDVVLDPAAQYMGFAWFQEEGGKIWWTLMTGA